MGETRAGVLRFRYPGEHGKGDKLAILMVHFGSAYPEARTQVLDVMNKRVKEAFPDVEVRQAYSARSVVSRLRAQGVWVQLPADALVELRDQGFTHVIIQPTIIIEGVEMEAIRKEAEQRKGLFKDLRVGNPLLYDDTDYEAVMKAVSSPSGVTKMGLSYWWRTELIMPVTRLTRNWGICSRPKE